MTTKDGYAMESARLCEAQRAEVRKKALEALFEACAALGDARKGYLYNDGFKAELMAIEAAVAELACKVYLLDTDAQDEFSVVA